MDEQPIDLRPLDPTLDRERWERRIATIAALAVPELARRAVSANSASPALVLLGWFRPALSAAAVLALCAGAALAMLLQSPAGAPEPAIPAMTEALRLPAPVAVWMGEEQPPSVADLASAVQGGQP